MTQPRVESRGSMPTKEMLRRFYCGQLIFFIATKFGQERVTVTVDDVTLDEDGSLALHGITYRGEPGAMIPLPNLTTFRIDAPKIEEGVLIGTVTVNGPGLDLDGDRQTVDARIVPRGHAEFHEINRRGTLHQASA